MIVFNLFQFIWILWNPHEGNGRSSMNLFNLKLQQNKFKKVSFLSGTVASLFRELCVNQ